MSFLLLSQYQKGKVLTCSYSYDWSTGWGYNNDNQNQGGEIVGQIKFKWSWAVGETLKSLDIKLTQDKIYCISHA